MPRIICSPTGTWETSMTNGSSNSLNVRELPDNGGSIVRAKTLIAVIAVITFPLICWLIIHFCFRKTAPAPADMSGEQAIKYMTSKEFAELPETEKIKYMENMRLRRGDSHGPPPQIASLSEEERQNMMRNVRPVMEKKIKEDMRKFFSMSQSEQEAEIDRRIEEMEARRKNDPGSGPPGGVHGGPGRDPRGMFEGGDSTTRAQMSKMMKMMRERMQARGVSGPGEPPP